MYNKILLNAYLVNNLGDDLFIRIICERFKNILFFHYRIRTLYKYL